MKHLKSLLICCLISVHAFAVTDSLKQAKPIVLETKTGRIRGTIVVPESKIPVPVVLLIAGSGPTDREGNNMYMKNNSAKMIAEALLNNNIASLRYDKRGIAESADAGPDEKDLRFDQYVDDAAAWIRLLKADKRFSKVIVAGHSEGSLIGMIAAKDAGADAFISIAGAGRPADMILKEQLKSQPPMVTQLCYPIIDSLKKGKLVDSVPQMLYTLFRPGVQPYMISWFRYDPQAEIAKLEIPVLILQGTTDIQVSESDAKALFNANKKAEYHLINGMNHVLKEADADRQKNVATYSNPDLPVKAELLSDIEGFIGTLK